MFPLAFIGWSAQDHWLGYFSLLDVFFAFKRTHLRLHYREIRFVYFHTLHIDYSAGTCLNDDFSLQKGSKISDSQSLHMLIVAESQISGPLPKPVFLRQPCRTEG